MAWKKPVRGSLHQQFVGEYQGKFLNMSLAAHKSVDTSPCPRISERRRCSHRAYYPAVSSSKKYQHVVAISRGRSRSIWILHAHRG